MGSSSSPVFACTAASCPAAFSSAQISAVRRSCQTIARDSARLVDRDQKQIVSRWLVIPIPAIREGPPAPFTTVRAQARVRSHISSASCSTQPGRG